MRTGRHDPLHCRFTADHPALAYAATRMTDAGRFHCALARDSPRRTHAATRMTNPGGFPGALPPRRASVRDMGVRSIRTAELVHRGGMRFETTTGSGRTMVFGDDEAANEFSPVETVAAALAGCSAMDVISILEKKRQVIDSYRIEVRADQRAEYPQVYTRIDVTHIVEGTVVLEAAVRRAIELSAAKYCPVNAMVSAGATEVHHHFRMRCTGAEPRDAQGEVIVTGAAH